MKLEILPITDDDFEVFIPPLFTVMGNIPFVATMYPDNHTPRGQRLAIERFMAEKAGHRGIRWIKICDTDNVQDDGRPEIIGVTQWAVLEDSTERYLDNVHFAPEGTWKDDQQKQAVEDRSDGAMQGRRNLLQREGFPMMCLNIMCVWPQYQRQGAGGHLLDWGCRLADEIGAVCAVEASSAGSKLYEKRGFEHYEGSTYFMVRPRKTTEHSQDFEDRM